MDFTDDNLPFMQSRLKPKRPKLRYLSWLEFFETVLSYRHTLTPLIVILCQFFIQALCEMIVSLYGQYWMVSSSVHDRESQQGPPVYLYLVLGMNGFILISGVLWILGLLYKDKVRQHRQQKNMERSLSNTRLQKSVSESDESSVARTGDSSPNNGLRRRCDSGSKKVKEYTKEKGQTIEKNVENSPFYTWFYLQGNKFHHMCVLTALVTFGIVCRLSFYWLQHDALLKSIASSACCVSLLTAFMLSLVYKGIGPKTKASDDSLMYSIGLSNAFLIVIFWKTIGSTLDWSIHNGWAQVLLWLKAFVALVYAIIMLRVYYWRQYVRKNYMRTDAADVYFEAIIEQEKESMEWWRVHILSVGLFCNFLLLYIIFGSPGVISRWVRGNYSASVIFQILAFGIFSFIMCYKPKAVGYLRPVTLRVINILIGLVCMTLAIRSQFVNYHYAFGIQQALVYTLHFMSPILLLNIQLICHEILRSKEKVSVSKISGGFFVSTILSMVLIICSAFSVVSSYMEPKWFARILFGQHDITFTIMVLFAIGPMFFVRTNSLIFFNNGVDDIYRGDGRKNFKLRTLAFSFALITAVATISVLIWTTPVQYYLNTPPKVANSELHMGAYNIRSGFDRNGRLNFSQHLENLKNLDFDIVALFESDTCRIANGNSDFVRYSANHLEMYSYYGPKPTEGTLGVSFLSKFPIIRRRTKTIITSSNGEKTAIIVSKLFLSRKRTINLIVAHFGEANFFEQVNHLSQELRRNTLNNLPSEGTILIMDFIPVTSKGPDLRREKIERIVEDFDLKRVLVSPVHDIELHKSSAFRSDIFFSGAIFQQDMERSSYIPHNEVNDVRTLSAVIRTTNQNGRKK